MDRHFSWSLGIPIVIQDENISTVLDESGSTARQDSVLSLQVRLWRLFTTIISCRLSEAVL